MPSSEDNSTQLNSTQLNSIHFPPPLLSVHLPSLLTLYFIKFQLPFSFNYSLCLSSGPTTMKTAHPHHHNHKQPPKQIKPPSRSHSLFSCTFFRHCTDSPLSPTPPQPSPAPPPPPPPPPSRQLRSPPPPSRAPHQPTKPSDSESSSSSTSQSFTLWRFPPTFPHPPLDPSPPPPPPPTHSLPPPPPPPLPMPLLPSDLRELFHVAELHFTTGSDSDRLSALQMMESSLVPNPPSDAVSGSGSVAVVVPAVVMSGVVGYMKEKAVAKSATKILLALCLAEGNRRVAVECEAAARVVDSLPDMEGTVAERALAALELMCTLPEGAAEVRAHALAVPMLVEVMGRMEGRGREYAIGVLASVYGGGLDNQLAAAAPPEEVARAVVLAMQQGDCSARGKRKGAQLLKVLQENGRLDLTQDA